MIHDLECPYCNEKLNVDHDYGFGYEEDVLHQMQCSHCEKEFVFTTSISFYYEPYKADCLNGSKHDYKPQTCFPKEYTKMECQMCGDVRKPTKEEMNNIMKEDF